MSASSSNPHNSEERQKEIDTRILSFLGKNESIPDSQEWLRAQAFNQPNDALLFESAVRSLKSDGYIQFEFSEIPFVELSAEALEIISLGSLEVRLFNYIKANGPSVRKEKVLQELFGDEALKLAQGNAMKNKWIKFDKDPATGDKEKDKLGFGAFSLAPSVHEVKDLIQQALITIHQAKSAEPLENTKEGKEIIKDLRRRGLITDRKSKKFSVTRGAGYSLTRKEKVFELTHEAIQSGAWENQKFKDYNFEALPQQSLVGTLHPLLKVRAEFRKILLGMGFSEMPTNKFVESSFWNFDALFQPQQHPARDAHDTFFLSEPEKSNLKLIEPSYLEAVKNIHQKGGFESIGYRYDWKEEEAEKNILRTHTTAVSTRMLYALAQEKEFRPVRYFSIDRVFRNETLDATHLAEFHQVEGLVADFGLTLGDLIGTIKLFFERIGMTNIKLKPAYNPYTEPSMEIFGYSTELDRWIEIGNSGVFRPEMLRPMGLPEGVNVIAWGLSLERPTMIKYGFKNIRDLFGHKVKLDLIQSNGIARFDQFHSNKL